MKNENEIKERIKKLENRNKEIADSMKVGFFIRTSQEEFWRNKEEISVLQWVLKED